MGMGDLGAVPSHGRPLIRPCGAPSPLGGEGFRNKRASDLPPSRGKVAFAKQMTDEGGFRAWFGAPHNINCAVGAPGSSRPTKSGGTGGGDIFRHPAPPHPPLRGTFSPGGGEGFRHKRASDLPPSRGKVAFAKQMTDEGGFRAWFGAPHNINCAVGAPGSSRPTKSGGTGGGDIFRHPAPPHPPLWGTFSPGGEGFRNKRAPDLPPSGGKVAASAAG